MTKPIHVAIGSTLSKPGDVRANIAQITAFADQAAADGVDLLLTPEMSASGYGPYPEVLATAEVPSQGPIYRQLADLARTRRLVICAGFVEVAGDKRHLAHYAVFPDGKWIAQRKHRVTRAERPLDPAVPLTPSGEKQDCGQPMETHFEYFQVRGVKCAISICADCGIDKLGEMFAANGVELMLAPTGAGGRRDQRVTTADLHEPQGRAKYLEMLQTVFFPGKGITDCIQYRRGLAAVNQCGYDGRQHYHVGHGMIINPMGEVQGFFHGLPNLDRQRPMYAHAIVDVADCLSPS